MRNFALWKEERCSSWAWRLTLCLCLCLWLQAALSPHAPPGVRQPWPQASTADLQLENFSIHGGSLFLTRIGGNPQLSVYGVVNRLAQGLAKKLTGSDVSLA